MIQTQYVDPYRFPQGVKERLKKAQAFSMPIFIGGPVGIGKTSLIRHYLAGSPYEYYSAWENLAAFRSLLEEEFSKETDTPRPKNEKKKQKRIVVLDDLQVLTDAGDREACQRWIREALESRQLWLLLLSRSRIPKWLSFLRMKYMFTLLSEEDLCFSRKQQESYLQDQGLSLDEETALRVWNLTRGHPFSLAMYCAEKGKVALAVSRGYDYLETQVLDQLERTLHDFLLDLSIVDSFTPRLASILTGNGDAFGLLCQAGEVGIFFLQTGTAEAPPAFGQKSDTDPEAEEVWEFRSEILQVLRRRLHRTRTTDHLNHLYGNAALYYELADRIPEALELYRKKQDMDGIFRLLLANARKSSANGHYFELRKYYLELSEDMIRESPELMAAMSLLQSRLMNDEESERWYRTLFEYACTATGSDRREAKNRLLYLDISLPHRGSEQAEAVFRRIGPLLTNHKAILPEIAVTSNLPSLMNGGMDFSHWSRQDDLMARTVGPVIARVLGRLGHGFVSLAVAESHLERGFDTLDVLSLAAKGGMQADAKGTIEISFVAVALKTWCVVLNGTVGEGVEMLSVFERRCSSENPRLLPNVRAFLTRLALYRGDAVSVKQWMETEAPNEQEVFCTTERFRYLTKVRCYLCEGKNREAYQLLQQLLYYCEKQKRTYIRMEANLLLAITKERLGDNSWKETLSICLREAEGFHFVRILSREGAAVYPLLTALEYGFSDEDYGRQVQKECRRMAIAYPDYLKSTSFVPPLLTERAMEVLRLQASGNSAEQIAQLLHISVSTVKYHSHETYKRLGVKNRSGAINEARRLKLL